MNQYLYRIQPTRMEMLAEGSTAAEDDAITKHFRYLQSLQAQGTLILAGRTLNIDNSSFGIVIFKAESEEAARAIMRQDPAIEQGVMRADLYPYRVALLAPENV